MALSNPNQAKKPWIETPLIESAALSKTAGCRVFLKLELLQPAGSFKSRGIGNLILTFLSSPENAGKKLHFYSSSGGNAGIAAVIASRDLNCPCTVIVPHSTKPMMIRKIEEAGAERVIVHGANWFEADVFLREKYIDNQDGQSGRRNIYIPPFDHPEIWRGAGGLVSEIAGQLPARDGDDDGEGFPADVIVCSVGGGGLFNGIIHGLQEELPKYPVSKDKNVQVVAVETEGADSLAHSLRNGSLQSLPATTSLATSLGALCVAPQTLKNAVSPPAGIEVKSVVGTDAEAAKGVVRLAEKMRLQVELACGISVQVVERLGGIVGGLTPESRVVVVVCGGNSITASMIKEYGERLEEGWV